MPKLPALTSKNLIDFLKSRGFVEDHASGSHLVFYNSQNKKRAVVPFHRRDIPKGTLLAILREAGFSRKDILNS